MRRRTLHNATHLWQEMASLRDRLEEAEETLRAISSGEVDALVIHGQEEDRIFTIAGAERPYRVLIEAMQEGAVTLSMTGEVLYANGCFARMIGAAPERVLGRAFADHVVPADAPAFRTLLARAAEGTAHGHVSLVGEDGRPVPVRLAMNALPLEGTASVCVVVTDLTDERRREDERRLLETFTVLGRAEDLDTALVVVLQAVVEIAGGVVAEAWLPRGGALSLRASWTAEDRWDDFVDEAHGATIARGEGLAGRAWLRGTPVWIDDLAPILGPETVRRFGVRAGLAIPVLARGECAAVIVVYLVRDASPDAARLEALQAAVGQLGAVIRRRRDDERIMAQLHEKEVLLKEVHHRVKNNLHVVTSLLHLQSRRIPDPLVKKLLLEAENRILSMALIHESLYRSPDLAGIPFGEYARTLLGQLVRTWVLPAGRIRLDVDVQPGLLLDIEAAMPLGLLVHELVSNALKHAFPNQRKGRVEVFLHPEAPEGTHLLLRVRDDGVGFPRGAAQPTPSMGLELVRTLADQLDGEVRFTDDEGVSAIVRFPRPAGARASTAD